MNQSQCCITFTFADSQIDTHLEAETRPKRPVMLWPHTLHQKMLAQCLLLDFHCGWAQGLADEAPLYLHELACLQAAHQAVQAQCLQLSHRLLELR